jgi:hypothetical protein
MQSLKSLNSHPAAQPPSFGAAGYPFGAARIPDPTGVPRTTEWESSAMLASVPTITMKAPPRRYT